MPFANKRRDDARDDHDKHRKRSHERDLAPSARSNISLDIRASVHARLVGKSGPRASWCSAARWISPRTR